MSDLSRYKDTYIYRDPSFIEVQGPFRAPVELLTPDDTWTTVRLTATDIAGLDNLAVRLYGPGAEEAWWAVILAAGVIDPERDLYPGYLLKVPPVSVFRSFQARDPNP